MGEYLWLWQEIQLGFEQDREMVFQEIWRVPFLISLFCCIAFLVLALFVTNFICSCILQSCKSFREDLSRKVDVMKAEKKVSDTFFAEGVHILDNTGEQSEGDFP